MSDLMRVAALAGGAALVGLILATGASPAPVEAVTEQVRPTRLLSPTFGYTVAYRTVDRNHQVHSTLRVFVYDHGRWRNVTPPHLHADGD